MKKLIFSIGLGSLMFSVACDKISEEDYLQATNIVADTSFFSDTTVVVEALDGTRHVLIEDYTGHTCGNCPEAAEKAKEIHDQNPEHTVVMAVHAGFFAKPKASGAYSTDYRTTEGEALDAFFGNSGAGNPNGMINRSGYPGQTQVKQFGSWSVLVNEELAKPVAVKLSTKVLYKDSTRTLRVNTRSTFLSDYPRPTRIVVHITEDSLVNWQKDYRLPSGQQDIENYVHRHMLRATLNGQFGESLTAAAATNGQVASAYFNYEIPEKFNVEHCSVVVAIMDAETYEVIQVKEIHITH